ncbi:MAG: hypothetical protein J6Q51_00250 [Clostridia bacterium]|nr:hypothetical protein [Clostridia bacterium]
MNDNTKKTMIFLACMVCSVLAVILVLRLSTLVSEVNAANVYGFKLNIESINLFSMIVYGAVAITIILAVITFIISYIDKPGCIKAVGVFKTIILVFLLIVSLLTLAVFVMDINKIDNTDKTLQTVDEVFDYTTMFTKFTIACQFLYNSFVVLIIANACSFFAAIEKYTTVVDVNKVMKDMHKEKQVKPKTMADIDAKLNRINLKNTTQAKPVESPKAEVKPTNVTPVQKVNSTAQAPAQAKPAAPTVQNPTVAPTPAQRPAAQPQQTVTQRPAAQPQPTVASAQKPVTTQQPTQRPMPNAQQPQQRVVTNPSQTQAPKAQNPGDKK